MPYKGVAAVEHDYRNILSHIDIDRTLDAIEYSSFGGIEDESVRDFRNDMEDGNDSIELHLIKSKAYREALVLRLKKSSGAYSDEWRNLLKEEQKTFGGSKIFYINNDCSRLLVLSLPSEMENKVNMVIARLNKINEKITRANAKIKKENIDVYASRVKEKAADKRRDEIANMINLNLRV